MVTKPSRLNRANFRERIGLFLEEIRRLGPQWHATRALYAEEIGNLLREFGEPGAEEWFEKAVTWYREATSEPTVKKALTLWKLGDGAAVEDECRRVVAFHRARLEAVREGSTLLPVQVMRAHQEMACAHFLLGEHREAIETSEAGLQAGYEARRPYVQTAVRDMAGGLIEQDAARFEKGLAVLEECVGEWPTASSGLHEDLYRYCLALRKKVFQGAVVSSEKGL